MRVTWSPVLLPLLAATHALASVSAEVPVATRVAAAGSSADAGAAPAAGSAPDAGSAPVSDAGVAVAPAAAPDAGAPTAAAPPAAVESKPSFIVMPLAANKSATDLAPALSQKLAQRLAAGGLVVRTQEEISRLIGAERQKELLGCADGSRSCLLELSNALGARYVTGGRIDRLGDHFLLDVSVTDALDAKTVVTSHREASDVDDLPGALDQVADELLAHFGIQTAHPYFTEADPMGFNLSLRLGSSLITSIAALAPEALFELAYRVSRSWAPFLQLGAAFHFDSTTTVDLTPGLLGLRHYFRESKSIQPTAGAGIGLLSTINTFKGTSRPSLVVLGGVEWFVIDRLGIGLEASIDLLGLAFEYADTGKTGLNLGLSLGVMYRF